MADLKISALPASTTPLAGTEVLPIVQSGQTRKVATDDLTVKNVRSNATTGILQVAGPAAAATRVMTTPDANFTVARTDAAQSFTGDQTLSTGNLVMGTAGKGIDFSINPAAPGVTSELLNDYEEGTWTPDRSFSGGNGTSAITSFSNTYTKIGRLVSVQCSVEVVKGTGSGNFKITGLPYASNGAAAVTVFSDGCGSASNIVVAQIANAATEISFSLLPQSTSYSNALTDAAMNATSYIRVQAVYAV